MIDTQTDGLLTPTEAGERLGVPTTTLVYWRAKHTGPAFVRLGEGLGRIRYRASDLDAYIAQSTVTPTN